MSAAASGSRPRIGMIWAEASDGAIGRGNAMPWHVPEDLANFKRITMNAPVIMGRRTWESLPERFRPLPGRENIVVSRNASADAPGARVVTSLDAALIAAANAAVADGAPRPATVWVMGGGQLYREAMPIADVLCVTRLDLDIEGADTFAPEIGPEFALVEGGETLTSSSGTRYRFERWERVRTT